MRLLAGPVHFGTVDDWAPAPGLVTCWHASPAAVESARQAPASAVPPSYQQARHLRGYCEHAAAGRDYSRLLIGTCDLAGQCDVRAMTYVINAHLRRHDTYRSWFEYRNADDIVRHTIEDPAAIAVAPIRHGEMTAEEMRGHILSTPPPIEWDCFLFGIIQRKDHFTVYLSIDHLHMDAQFTAMILLELQTMYGALAAGGQPVQLPEAGSYHDYCVRQREYASALTADSPQVRAWIEYADHNAGSVPNFPLPLGESGQSGGDTRTVTLLDEQQTQRFESACLAGGARFIGGVLACLALTERELTGSDTYYGLTPIDTRSTPAEHMTLGWFTGWVPITVPVAATSFPDVARAAQDSFDSGIGLAKVPFDRVIELAPHLRRPRPNWPLLNFLDGGVAPASMLLAALEGRNAGLYGDGRSSYQLSIFVHRFADTTMTIVFPNNPVALDSVSRYLATMKSVCVRVAEDRQIAWPRSRSG